MVNPGLLYVKNPGIPQNYVHGCKWINLAVAAGLVGAVDIRDGVAASLSPAPPNEA